MAKTVIHVEDVWKRYRLGVIGATTLRDDLKRLSAKLRGKEDPTVPLDKSNHLNHKTKDAYTWALQNINLEIKEGEVIGIIGKNGAGKSTLLKILSKITPPTRGRVKIRGRIASLLEVGTGMHPELTGIENIYLNGAILGMSRREIKEKLDDIIDFAGIAKYADTPVKRYSSGMRVRLGFAVAAFLEPDILIVDEVLAVGDAEFQKRAVGKMKEVSSGQGRTVLFVSHNMASVQHLCHSGVVLDKGRVVYQSQNIDEVIQYYAKQVRQQVSIPLMSRNDRSGRGEIRVQELCITDTQGNLIDTILTGQAVNIELAYKVSREAPLQDVMVALSLRRFDGTVVTTLSTEYLCSNFQQLTGEGRLLCHIPRLPLTSGEYILNVMIRSQGEIQDWLEDACVLCVENGDFFGTGQVVPASHPGVLFEHMWKHK
ncbi:ABC transporter ATP-binding protein [Thermonema rossianum]|uniref:ABC transporter ATP-binding protein n=1 Tax=Thermonema rossianum TaxID=55505 RepID=UPI00056F1FD8|nr:ABC transporter ATP-binding protein [Thermonema rossianum]